MNLKICSCSRCVGENSVLIKYGKTRCGKQRYQCKHCKATRIFNYRYNAYKSNINSDIIKLTKEGLGIRSTARVLDIPNNIIQKNNNHIRKNFCSCDFLSSEL